MTIVVAVVVVRVDWSVVVGSAVVSIDDVGGGSLTAVWVHAVRSDIDATTAQQRCTSLRRLRMGKGWHCRGADYAESHIPAVGPAAVDVVSSMVSGLS
ncbi:hypothetical protein MPHO_50610 [Mycolicibacterium phocaicum]|nr:hypothetical protein MPHO_50610 [Mycolicibacterium phocaicum]